MYTTSDLIKELLYMEKLFGVQPVKLKIIAPSHASMNWVAGDIIDVIYGRENVIMILGGREA